MDTLSLIFAIATGALAFVVIWLWQKWATERLADQLVHEIINTDPHQKLNPENDFAVDVTETGATCRRPDGKTESVKWNDLQRVEILTTDDGPHAPDMFWVLYGSSEGCVIPWGATGEQDLMNRLQALPGFRSDVIVDAVQLTANNQLLCWARAEQNA